ncbi:hypothetical protein LMG28138_03370 [Pararobbsia alpina]|uniref:Integrase catalytic domain-containing protein n=1 Tax=Pararobbsia alpina TaxID=621374 RepID=A0A6S7BR36_9BURK|nr:hypothetical protein LMG28138_03370 [Pararobbsia alpina]
MLVKDAPVIAIMRTLSGIYPRFGAGRIRIMLGREGMRVGKERCARLWAQAGLQVPKKRRRRRVASHRPRVPVPMARNTVWSYDFVFDGCANGQQLKCLTVVDEYTRECLAIDVAGSIRSQRVVDVLSDRLCIFASDLHQHHEARLTFDESRDLAVCAAERQIALPVAQYRAVLDCGREFAYRYSVTDSTTLIRLPRVVT